MARAKTKKFRVQYAKPRARFAHKDVPVIASELERLASAHGGVTPAIVLREAKRSRSKLHRFFDWDDKEAADKWRLEQAGEMIRAVRVVIIDESSGREVAARAYVSVKTRDVGKMYIPTLSAMSDAEYREQVLARALDELRDWQIRYQNLQELADLFSVIEAKAPKAPRRKRKKAA